MSALGDEPNPPRGIDLLAVLDALDFGVAVVSTRLDRIYHRNALAEQILTELGGPKKLPGEVVEAFAGRLSDHARLPAVRISARNGSTFFVRARLATMRSPKAVLTLTPAVVREQDLGQVVSRRFGLSTQHARVIKLLRCGLSNREIAGQLGVSPITVKHYLSEALTAVGARSRLELVSVTHSLVDGEAA